MDKIYSELEKNQFVSKPCIACHRNDRMRVDWDEKEPAEPTQERMYTIRQIRCLRCPSTSLGGHRS